MRRRLMRLVFTTTLFALVLVGVAMFASIWVLRVRATTERTEDTVRVAAYGLAGLADAGRDITQADVEAFRRAGVTLTVRLPDGRVLVAGDPVGPGSITAYASSQGVTVQGEVPVSTVAGQFVSDILVYCALSFVALLVAMAVAASYARRITRPLEDFADTAAALAGGDRRRIAQRYGVPELDAVAEVLDRAVQAFTEVLESERRITTETAHQLRTPLTALSLRLEEILETDELSAVREEALAALGQVERLSGVVDEVAALHRGHSPMTPVSVLEVDDLVAGQITEWAPAYEGRGRTLVRLGATGLQVEVQAGAQAQALATLVENSLLHGSGTTTIRVRAAGSWVVLEVGDEGPGIPDDLAAHVFERSVSGSDSSGLGLALARVLVTSDGGRLELVSTRPAVFAIFLPAVAATADDDEPGSRPSTGPEGQTVERIVASSAASVSSGNTQRR